MGVIFQLLGGFKGLATIALVVVLGGYIWNQNRKISAANDQVTLVKAQRDLAAGERDKAVQVNNDNQIAIAKLAQEKNDTQTALNNLESARRKDSVTIGQLSAAIRSQSKNPANQITLSPVLKDVVAGIQTERNRRQGVTK